MTTYTHLNDERDRLACETPLLSPVSQSKIQNGIISVFL
jgi:hypothetical protein